MSFLVFTIAHNAYRFTYRDCLDSQRRYCDRNGYTHVAVTRPRVVREPALSAWLKIPLLLRALDAGYEGVAFVDSDCLVADATPALSEPLTGGHPVKMARGRSGRWNSGVILARTEAPARTFFSAVLESLSATIPAEQRRQLKFENGNVVHVAERDGGVDELDRRWNNTTSPELDDFVRHFTGPMRETHRVPLLRRAAGRFAAAGAATPTPAPATKPPTFIAALASLTEVTVSRYPALGDARAGR